MDLEKLFFNRPNKIYLPKIIDKLNSLISQKNLIYLNSNYLYLDIPKSASSFIKSIIISSNNLGLNCGPNYPHSAVFKRPRINEDISRFKIISFMRDPIDRFCSVIRQKFQLENKNQNIMWSPYIKPLKFLRYKFSEVDLLIDRIVNQPLAIIDKHLLPQSYFINFYSRNNNLEIFKTSQIENKLSSIFDNDIVWPSKNIALKTDKSLFNSKDLTQKSIMKLKDFYKMDYDYIENLI